MGVIRVQEVLGVDLESWPELHTLGLRSLARSTLACRPTQQLLLGRHLRLILARRAERTVVA